MDHSSKHDRISFSIHRDTNRTKLSSTSSKKLTTFSLTDRIWTAIILISIFINTCNAQPVAVVPLTDAQKQEILDKHNDVRNQVAAGNYPGFSGNLPPATNMNELLWDEGLAALAEDISDNCDEFHSGSTTGELSGTSFELPATAQDLGENLAFSTTDPPVFSNGNTGITELVDLWIDEGQAYDYGTIDGGAENPGTEFCDETDIPSNPGRFGCGHFTQIVWADTRYVGCGVSDCSAVDPDIATNVVCLYYQAGNFFQRFPYNESGNACDNCDGDRTANCDANNDLNGDRSSLCGGGVDSSFDVDGETGTTADVDDCDNGLGVPLANCPVDATTTPGPDDTESPTTTTPTTSAPTTVIPSQPPTTAQPTTSAPTTSAPTTATPTTAVPTQSPITFVPSESPTTGVPSEPPTTAEPTTAAPTTDRPTTAEPTTGQPSVSPTSASPTTANPTTDTPTTGTPTTGSPTSNPTTATPTSAAPTTFDPTTAAPTTAEPTSDDTTTLAPDEEPEPDTTDSADVLVGPETCENRCDAFSVFVDSYRYDADGNLCLTYNVERLFDTGLCRKSIKYVVLGLCQDDIGDASYNDINGIIQDFDLIQTERRRLGSGSYSSSDDDYRQSFANDDDITGILINVNIATSQSFELCLEDVFLDPPQFSETVRFKRGRREFTCSDDEEAGENYLQGLPCLDAAKFQAGGYGNDGNNRRRWRKKNKRGGSGYSRALTNSEESTNENWGALSDLDPMVRWSLVSIFIVFGLLIIVSGYICIVKRKKDKESGSNIKQAMEMATHIANVPSSTLNKTGESFTQDDDGDVDNETNLNTINENGDDEDVEFEDEFFDGDEIDLGNEETAKEAVSILNEDNV